MIHHTKTFGDLGVLKAQLDLYQKGYTVCIPLTEHAPFDLIIFKAGVCQTVQVKARTLNAKNQLNVDFRSCYSDSKGVHVTPVNKNDIDLYCIYCSTTDKCYYFDPKEFNKSVTLRVGIPKNNQRTNIRFAEDYYDLPKKAQ